MSDRCPACPGLKTCVKPNGPEGCNGYTFLGEAPGFDEDKKDMPFVGKTGREVNEHYLPLAGLSRPRVRFTNAIRCYPDRPKGKLDLKKRKDQDLLKACAEWHLYPELERTKPKLIIPMGAFACHALDPDINLELHHGLPYQTAWGMTFPMYHPAGGIHEPKKMLHIRTDWVRLRQYIKGTLRLPVDAHPQVDYQECRTPDDLDYYLSDASTLQEAFGTPTYWAFDTEWKRLNHEPFCITLSVEDGTARLIRADNRATLDRLQQWIDRWAGDTWFQNWLADEETCRRMGLRFNWGKVRDTMVKLFHLGNLPQGLKAVAYRELGMTMQDFDDVVTPHSKPIVLEYYRQAMLEDFSIPDEELVRQDDGSYKIYKPHSFNRKVKTFWTTYAKDEDSKDVFEIWTKGKGAWGQLHGDEVEAKLGPWPGKCISHVPFDLALQYACRDADATRRLVPFILHCARRARKFPQELWRDDYEKTYTN